MWVWPSMNPGATINPSASITRRAGSLTRPTDAMRPPEMPTSAVKRFAPEPSTTVPPLIRRSSTSGSRGGLGRAPRHDDLGAIRAMAFAVHAAGGHVEGVAGAVGLRDAAGTDRQLTGEH